LSHLQISLEVVFGLEWLSYLQLAELWDLLEAISQENENVCPIRMELQKE
jgi:hypothetical protein